MTRHRQRHGETRTERLELVLTPTDMAVLRKLAEDSRRSMNSFMEEWLDWLREKAAKK